MVRPEMTEELLYDKRGDVAVGDLQPARRPAMR
jgi:hypothetical protein